MFYNQTSQFMKYSFAPQIFRHVHTLSVNRSITVASVGELTGNAGSKFLKSSESRSNLGNCYHGKTSLDYTSSLLQPGDLLTYTPRGHNFCQVRFYNKRKTIKILPTKPLNFDYGGDITKDECPLDLQKPKVSLDGAEELKYCNDVTKRLLSLEFADGSERLKSRVKDIVSRVQEHPLDVRSLEVIIALQTVHIRAQMRHVLNYRKDKKAKSLLVLRLQARRKHLGKLRSLDYEKFLWLCEELQMKYIPVPQYNHFVSKRAKLKRDARNMASKIINEKMSAFRKQLAKEKEEFYNFKEQELADIEKEIEKLKLDDSSEIKRVFEALKFGDVNTLDGTIIPLPSRRTQILQHKFKLAEKIAKERAEKV